MSAPDIFLSYNREDQAVADRFLRGFEGAGLSVWWDMALRAGEVYDEVTEKALREARAVVVLWSERSVKSRWVRAEATLAQRCGTIVPCMIEPCERPVMFELVQTADLSSWTGDPNDPAWRDFLAHVRELADAGSAAAPSARNDLPAQETPPRAASERRQVTFLSAAISNGSSLASNLDPEDWHDLITRLHPIVDPVIAEYGGRADWQGHQVSAVFGYPVAHEDVAMRAIRAGLEMVKRTGAIAGELERQFGGAVALHVGIHTSNALITSSGEGDPEMFGNGQSAAERICRVATPGAVWVSEAIHELASGAFAFESVSTDDDMAAVFAVTGRKTRGRPGRGWTSADTASFVGRDDELALLESRWNRAQAGEGQYVLVRGEPGIGKTRLIEQFRATLADREHCWISLRGASLFPNTPYHAIGEMVARQAEKEGSEGVAFIDEAVRRMGLAPKLSELLPYAIGLASPDDKDTAGGRPEPQRGEMLAAMVDTIFAIAEKKPVVLFVDDLQWIDPSTLECIHMLVDQSEGDALFILGTARPEFRPPWSERENHSRINLGRLSKDDVAALVTGSAGSETIDPKLLATILDRADGVPLFAEELTRLLLASGGEGEGAALPPTLRNLLAARIDRLGPGRELLQIASIVGRDFAYPLLAKVASFDDAELAEALEQLVDEQFLFARGVPPRATYRFKHALIQDAAYAALPKKRQAELHGVVARTISRDFPEMHETQGELIATHWTRAGAAEEAVDAWQRAGDWAFRHAACTEAAAHFTEGLALVSRLEEGKEREAREMKLWSALNRALQQTLGYSDPRTVEAANKALEFAKHNNMLGKALTEEAQLWRAVITAGDYEDADAIAERVKQSSAELGGSQPIPWLDYFYANARVQTGFYKGRLATFESDFANFRRALEDSELSHSPGDVIVSIGVAGLAAWMAGNSRLGAARIEEVLDLGEQSGQPYALAMANHFAGTFVAFERDYEAMREHSLRALKVSEEHGFNYIAHLVRAKLGWAYPSNKPSEEDIEAIRRAIDEMAKANALVALIFNMNRLALALQARGEIEEALTVIEEAMVANPQERIVRPQSLAIRGSLKADMGDAVGAEENYREAIAIAAEMGALALELEAVVLLAGLLADSGRTEEAAAALSATLAKCTDDTNSPGLSDAQDLLAKLEAAMTR